MYKLIFLMLLSVSFFVNAQQLYSSIDSMIGHFYLKSDNNEYPWRKKDSDANVSDYTLCHNDFFNPQRQQFIIVMCPNMWQENIVNTPPPTDVYIMQKTVGGYILLVSEKNVGADFLGVVDIGNAEKAIHFTYSERNPNQGYSQAHDNLSIISGHVLKKIAEWTSLRDNTEFVDSAVPDTRVSSEKIENTIIIDDHQKYLKYYPLTITSIGKVGEQKVNKKYLIDYSPKEERYLVPDELNKSY
ncbi:hypothetical protein [Serratia aquatilis]|uniref:DUF1571 domain-containing protein n=1 Tax=Serratia aquatilis TaxID=1737515 RepID=A0ABV6E7D4_9GAMM